MNVTGGPCIHIAMTFQFADALAFFFLTERILLIQVSQLIIQLDPWRIVHTSVTLDADFVCLSYGRK